MLNLYIKFVFIVFPLFLYATPSWYGKNSTINKNEIVGYGESQSIKEAKQNALKEIATTITVDIKSSKKLSKFSSDYIYEKKFSESSYQKSNAILSGVRFIKQEEYNNIWYVKAIYDNSPLSMKIKKLLPEKLSNEIQNNYSKNSTLFQNLKDEIKYDLDYKIIRKDKLWQIKYKDIILPIVEKDFEKLFYNKSNKMITLKTNQEIYKEGDELSFKIKIAKKGYVSILYSEVNGKVGVLLSNFKAKLSFDYPAKESEDIFIIENPTKKIVKELYVAIYTKKPIALDEFENIGEDLLDESNYTFNRLINILDRVQFSTSVIKIK